MWELLIYISVGFLDFIRMNSKSPLKKYPYCRFLSVQGLFRASDLSTTAENLAGTL